LHNKQTTALTP